MKKEKWWVRLLIKIGVIGTGMIVNNQKGVKGTENVDKVNDIVDEIKSNI